MFNLKKNKGEKGITLIALIVTIIVLLILAGVSIAMLTGENGILTQAQNAKNKTEEAATNEAKILNEYEDKLDEYTKTDKDSLKIVVNSGENGGISFYYEEGEFEIDWGDGSINNINDKVGENIKLASIDNVKVADALFRSFGHDYAEKNKEYIISITSKNNEFKLLQPSNEYLSDSRSKLIRIENWGNVGLETINLAGCTNLTEIASPNKDSFKNIKDFSGMFANTGLTSIPEDLFANCPNVIDFSGTFYNTKITEIPEVLFKNCNKAESFLGTFANCTELTNYLPLWDSQYYNGGNTNVGIDKVGESCYGGCTKLLQKEENLNAIPEFWCTDLN